MNDLTLSVVSHGHGELLAALLGDLARLPGAGKARVIVTLNLAGEAFDPGRFAPLRIEVRRNERPRGFGANHNAAFRSCDTAWFVVLNPDLRLPVNPFPALAQVAAADTSLAALTPLVVSPQGHQEDHVRRNLTLASLWRRRRGGETAIDASRPSRRPMPFYWLAGMFLMLRSTAFRKIGGFDERLFLYCEDFDLCARLYLDGQALRVVESAQVVHDARRDSHRSMKHLRWHVASLLKVWTSAAFWRLVALGRMPPH